ncbi:hypothetical protein NDU88_007282 [Pleurodeles waltl]|uniref:Uncharacterized protein n=1 Tax=Pleurodeles waltl TaxID=8319 RepID=A0AAV7U354_PLEWA|nr:hypothetical protein NDU88_007282 [Pleurodeles waltl]
MEPICDGSLFRQADPSGREQTVSASPDAEEHKTSANRRAGAGIGRPLLGQKRGPGNGRRRRRGKQEEGAEECLWRRTRHREDGGTTGRVARRVRGAGGTLRKSRPCLKESVASTGAWGTARKEGKEQ